MSHTPHFHCLKPHAIHFARLRGELQPWYVNDLLKRALCCGDTWNYLMSLIYAN